MKEWKAYKEKYDSQGPILKLTLKSHVTERALCYTVLICSIMYEWLHLLCLIYCIILAQTESAIRGKKNGWLDVREDALSSSAVHHNGSRTDSDWTQVRRRPIPLRPIPPSHSSAGYKSACVTPRSDSWMFHLQTGWSCGKSLFRAQLAGKVHPVFPLLHNNHFSHTWNEECSTRRNSPNISALLHAKGKHRLGQPRPWPHGAGLATHTRRGTWTIRVLKRLFLYAHTKKNSGWRNNHRTSVQIRFTHQEFTLAARALHEC